MPPIEKRLSLSTCWCSHRHIDGYEMLTEMRELGFERVELSHGIRMSLLPGIMKAIDDGLVEISSVHNFCPLPNSVQHAAPNLYEPSARSASERNSWKQYTIQTLEFAEKLGANAVVMHSGSIDSRLRAPETTTEENPELSPLREKHFKQLRRQGGPNSRRFHRIVAAYRDVLPIAAAKEISLCVENREGALELPLDDDFPALLAELAQSLSGEASIPKELRYWHDTGHARLKERMGFIDHRKHLETVASEIAGFHLHDVSNDGHDHQAPGTGTVDFEMIRDFITEKHILVAELSPKLSAEEVLRSRGFLVDLLG